MSYNNLEVERKDKRGIKSENEFSGRISNELSGRINKE